MSAKGLKCWCKIAKLCHFQPRKEPHPRGPSMSLGERHPPLPAQTKLTREASAPSVQCTGAKPPNLHTRSAVREGLPAESDGLSKRPLTQVHKGTTRGKAHTPIPPGAIAPPWYVSCCTPLPLFSLMSAFLCVLCLTKAPSSARACRWRGSPNLG